MGGELVVQGEDLGAWVAGQRVGWERLMPAQRSSAVGNSNG